MSTFFNYNGRLYKEGTPVIGADNRSLRYGYGLFETIKMVGDRLLLRDYHFDRLFHGMQVLAFDLPPHFNRAFIENEITMLARKNGHIDTTRIRFTVFPGNGSLYEHENQHPSFIIQSWDIAGTSKLNEDGLLLDVYPLAKKSCDVLANLKTNNFLPYSLAAVYARKNFFNDCVMLNSSGRICDTTIANIFIIKHERIYTPPLKEGCIAGVMRKYIIQQFRYHKITTEETPLTLQDLKNADEVFVTNSIYPVRWVKQFQDSLYGNDQILYLYTLIDQLFD